MLCRASKLPNLPKLCGGFSPPNLPNHPCGNLNKIGNWRGLQVCKRLGSMGILRDLGGLLFFVCIYVGGVALCLLINWVSSKIGRL